jgi:hypothetical protein
MANTLDLDPECGGIDLVDEVEAAFGIKVADDEAERCWTVGDLYDVIRARTPHWDEQDGSCASSAVFYRFRRALAPEEKREVSPSSALRGAGMSIRQLFNTLRKETGLRLPTEGETAIGVVAGWLCLLGFIGGLIALYDGAWIAAGVGALAVAVGILLGRLEPARLPLGVATVGDLVRRTVALNAQDLARTGARPPDRWAVLVALAAEHGSLPPDQIGPDTFLLRKSMEMAAKRG